MNILESRRLVFRHFLPADLERLAALYCDPRVRQYILGAPLTYEGAREELEWFLNGHPQQPALSLWATIHRESGQFIGRCGLLPWTIDGQPEMEVAYLLSRAYWGQGLGTEAAQAILDYGFEQLGLKRLICLIDPHNVASIKVASKIGMTFEKEGQDELGPYLVYSRTRQPGPVKSGL